MITLDILSDPICPWCLIGKTGLDRALARHPGQPFTITWHPFMLNPDMPPGGMDRRAYLEAKFGGPEGAGRVYGRIAEHARAAGVEIDFDAIGRTPSTVDAHRLIHWAGVEGRQDQVVDALFRAYFREGRDIGDKAVLAEIAGEAGMDAEMTATLLAGESDAAEIRARDAHARARGVNGVPTFVVAGQYVLTGAQPADTWEKVIEELGRLDTNAASRAGA